MTKKSSPATTIALTELVFDATIYPRANVDEMHVKHMEDAMEGGITLPPIIVERRSKRIVDGTHRYHAALHRGLKHITCTFKDYQTEADLFRESVMLNTGIGLKLGGDDQLKVIQVSERLDLKEIDVAAMLRTSISHLRVIRNRFATVEEAIKGVKESRKVPLKGSVRHLSGERITKQQATAIASAPGQSYLLSIRQLISAIENDLLPPRDKHPALWNDLERLQQGLERLLQKRAA
jgi:hypothetical protein